MLVDAASFIVVGLAGLSLAVRRGGTQRADGERRRARDGIGFLSPIRPSRSWWSSSSSPCCSCPRRSRRTSSTTEDVLGVEDIGIGIVVSAWTLGMLIGSNVVGRRIPLGALAAAAMAGVTVPGLGKFIAPFWLTFGFMIVMYVFGGVGHQDQERRVAYADPRPYRERHGRAFAV